MHISKQLEALSSFKDLPSTKKKKISQDYEARLKPLQEAVSSVDNLIKMQQLMVNTLGSGRT